MFCERRGETGVLFKPRIFLSQVTAVRPTTPDSETSFKMIKITGWFNLFCKVCKIALLSQIRNSEQKNQSHAWWKLFNVCPPSEICANVRDLWFGKVMKSKIFIRQDSSYHWVRDKATLSSVVLASLYEYLLSSGILSEQFFSSWFTFTPRWDSQPTGSHNREPTLLIPRFVLDTSKDLKHRIFM